LVEKFYGKFKDGVLSSHKMKNLVADRVPKNTLGGADGGHMFGVIKEEISSALKLLTLGPVAADQSMGLVFEDVNKKGEAVGRVWDLETRGGMGGADPKYTSNQCYTSETLKGVYKPQGRYQGMETGKYIKPDHNGYQDPLVGPMTPRFDQVSFGGTDRGSHQQIPQNQPNNPQAYGGNFNQQGQPPVQPQFRPDQMNPHDQFGQDHQNAYFQNTANLQNAQMNLANLA
jgi:hypothetical protein